MSVNRKYFVLFNTQYFEVFPRNTDKAKFITTREKDQIFYRKKLNGKLSFVNNDILSLTDFTFFKNIEFSPDACNEIKFEVRRLCNGTYSTEWRGYFSVSKGYFDFDQCIFTVDISPDDEYRCVMENWNRQVNILDVEDEITTNALVISNNFEYHVCRSNSIDCTTCAAGLPTPSTSWTLLHNEVDGDPNGSRICIYYREKVTTNCLAGIPQPPTGAGWVLLTDDCAGTGTSDYVRQPPSLSIPNPDIQQGICNSGVAAPPPPQINLDVELITGSAASSFPQDVIGRLDVGDTETDLYFRVEGADDSTYSWVIADTTGMINITGLATKQLSFDLSSAGANNGTTIYCNETTICGDTIQHQLGTSGLSIHHVVTNPYPLPATNFLEISGPTKLCKNQTGIIYRVPEEWRVDTVGAKTWSVPPGATIVSGQGTWEIVVDLDGTLLGTLSLVSISLTPNIPYISTGSWTKSFSATISNNPITEPITGAIIVCNASVTKYKVWNRVGSTFTWSVTGGTVTAGQGTNEAEITWGGVDGDFVVSVKEVSSCGCSWNLIADCGVDNTIPYYWCAENQGVPYTLNHNRDLYDVIEYFIAQLPCVNYDGVMVSDFFEHNPVGDTPGYLAGYNYVTGIINRVNMLTIAQKSDTLDPDASNPATIGKMSFKHMTEILREVFNVYWFLVPLSNGLYQFRMEQIKYFNYSTGLNLFIAPKSETVKAQNKYNHLNELMPKFERYRMMEMINRDFIGAEIRYESQCVNQDSETNIIDHNVVDVTTDIQGIIQNPGDIDLNGFTLLANELDSNGDYVVISEVGRLSGAIMPNAHLSWANLHWNYHRHDRILKNGYMNEVLTDFFTFKRNIRQVPLQFKLCCDETFDPNLKVITELGSKYLGGIYGNVDTAEENLKDEIMKLTLTYSLSQ